MCNMDCRMCYVRMSRQQQEAICPLRTAQEWLALGEEAKKRGMLYLLLTGGEPFSRPDFREILSGLHRMGFIISINSNGTLIDEEVVEWLKKTPPTRVNLTLYGASNETYVRLCRNPNGFTQVIRAIHLLKEAGITVKLNRSLTPYNARDLEKIIDFAKEEQWMEYTGCTCNFKTYSKSYKRKKRIPNAIENMCIFPDTQEAFVSQAQWDRVQELRKNKRRPTKAQRQRLFSGLLFCPDCGNKLHFATCKSFDGKQDHYVCSSYKSSQCLYPAGRGEFSGGVAAMPPLRSGTVKTRN
ncbi:radical SAM protein [Ruminococcus sp. YH-rum2234]|uniref:Radical SAM protein n=1 Tax=Fusibacillus kribbianus TaxID=3044208 RepID=A0AAP4BCJ3_9FIRM|nr:radical SAM protein [Ruminococcus sp. YH-rum2234]MDI9241819.1 radical SAM protein [Ruminococcus sp. YH-rum2234]